MSKRGRPSSSESKRGKSKKPRRGEVGSNENCHIEEIDDDGEMKSGVIPLGNGRDDGIGIFIPANAPVGAEASIADDMDSFKPISLDGYDLQKLDEMELEIDHKVNGDLFCFWCEYDGKDSEDKNIVCKEMKDLWTKKMKDGKWTTLGMEIQNIWNNEIRPNMTGDFAGLRNQPWYISQIITHHTLHSVHKESIDVQNELWMQKIRQHIASQEILEKDARGNVRLRANVGQLKELVKILKR